MSIVNFNTDNPTPKQVLQNQTMALKAEISRQFDCTYNLFLKVLDFVWNNDNFTPQQVFDAFGSDAAELCKISNAAVAMLTVLGHPVAVNPPGVTLTINSDGTVTLGS